MNRRKSKNQSFILSIIFASVCLLGATILRTAANIKAVSNLETAVVIPPHTD